MGVYRIYKGDDDRSHIEEFPPHDPFWSRVKTSSTMFLKEFPPGTFLDWHPAPRRQIVIILSGRLEHGFRDGSMHTFGPGDVRVLVDTTGEGHTTRVLGDETVLVAVVPLADDNESGGDV
jgi:quercetin dioxygenase-like cupin family protein